MRAVPRMVRIADDGEGEGGGTGREGCERERQTRMGETAIYNE